MNHVLGPDLAAVTNWPAVDEKIPAGDLAAIHADAVDVHKWLHYLPIYEDVLAPFRARPIRMLEIGVFHGGSLAMWRRYLHPDSVIVGIDIDPATRQYDAPDDNVHVRVGAQQDLDFLQSVIDEFGPFDVILDDGSHISSHIIDTFRFLFPNALLDGGAYLVEDLHANYWTGYRDTPMTFADFTMWLTHAMHAHYVQANAETRFRAGDKRRLTSHRVPFATTIIGKIEIHDSITIVYRTHRHPPCSVYK